MPRVPPVYCYRPCIFSYFLYCTQWYSGWFRFSHGPFSIVKKKNGKTAPTAIVISWFWMPSVSDVNQLFPANVHDSLIFRRLLVRTEWAFCERRYCCFWVPRVFSRHNKCCVLKLCGERSAIAVFGRRLSAHSRRLRNVFFFMGAPCVPPMWRCTEGSPVPIHPRSLKIMYFWGKRAECELMSELLLIFFLPTSAPFFGVTAYLAPMFLIVSIRRRATWVASG